MERTHTRIVKDKWTSTLNETHANTHTHMHRSYSVSFTSLRVSNRTQWRRWLCAGGDPDLFSHVLPQDTCRAAGVCRALLWFVALSLSYPDLDCRQHKRQLTDTGLVMFQCIWIQNMIHHHPNKHTRVDAKFRMHNLFLTDIVDEQIHVMKPGTSSLRMTYRCTTTATVHRATFKGNTNQLKKICLNISRGTLSCQDYIKNGVAAPAHFPKHFSSLTRNCWPVEMRHVLIKSLIRARESLLSYMWTYSRSFCM